MILSACVDTSVARERASRAFGAEPGAVVYVDRMLRGPGTVTLGPEEVNIEHPALLVFRDEAPGANWMHPCTYALVDLESGAVVISATADRPPQFGLLPKTWVVAADPGGRADLLRPDDYPLEEK